MAFQGTVRHLGTGVGALAGAFLLETDGDGRLLNIPTLLGLYLIILSFQPILTYVLTHTLKSEQSAPIDAA
jgi:hypothetical protein